MTSGSTALCTFLLMVAAGRAFDELPCEEVKRLENVRDLFHNECTEVRNSADTSDNGTNSSTVIGQVIFARFNHRVIVHDELIWKPPRTERKAIDSLLQEFSATGNNQTRFLLLLEAANLKATSFRQRVHYYNNPVNESKTNGGAVGTGEDNPFDEINVNEINVNEINVDEVTEDGVTEDGVTEDDVTEDDVTEDEVTEDSVTEDDVTEDEVNDDEANDDEANDDEANDDEMNDEEVNDEEVNDDELFEDSYGSSDTQNELKTEVNLADCVFESVLSTVQLDRNSRLNSHSSFEMARVIGISNVALAHRTTECVDCSIHSYYTLSELYRSDLSYQVNQGILWNSYAETGLLLFDNTRWTNVRININRFQIDSSLLTSYADISNTLIESNCELKLTYYDNVDSSILDTVNFQNSTVHNELKMDAEVVNNRYSSIHVNLTATAMTGSQGYRLTRFVNVTGNHQSHITIQVQEDQIVPAFNRFFIGDNGPDGYVEIVYSVCPTLQTVPDRSNSFLVFQWGKSTGSVKVCGCSSLPPLSWIFVGSIHRQVTPERLTEGYCRVLRFIYAMPVGTVSPEKGTTADRAQNTLGTSAISTASTGDTSTAEPPTVEPTAVPAPGSNELSQQVIGATVGTVVFVVILLIVIITAVIVIKRNRSKPIDHSRRIPAVPNPAHSIYRRPTVVSNTTNIYQDPTAFSSFAPINAGVYQDPQTAGNIGTSKEDTYYSTVLIESNSLPKLTNESVPRKGSDGGAENIAFSHRSLANEQTGSLPNEQTGSLTNEENGSIANEETGREEIPHVAYETLTEDSGGCGTDSDHEYCKLESGSTPASPSSSKSTDIDGDHVYDTVEPTSGFQGNENR